MNENKFEKLVKIIKDHAKKDLRAEDPDFDPQDYSGGNFDDALQIGIYEGYTMLAQELVTLIEDNS